MKHTRERDQKLVGVMIIRVEVCFSVRQAASDSVGPRSCEDCRAGDGVRRRRQGERQEHFSKVQHTHTHTQHCCLGGSVAAQTQLRVGLRAGALWLAETRLTR